MVLPRLIALIPIADFETFSDALVFYKTPLKRMRCHAAASCLSKLMATALAGHEY